MKTADLDFPLPEELIALRPAHRRDASRLMVLGPGGEPPAHRTFTDLPGYLRPGDMLLMNNTRVMPCRLLCARPDGKPIEVLLVRPLGDDRWAVLSRGGYTGRVTTGGGRVVLDLEHGLEARVHAEGDLMEALREVGHMPLPPYIKRAPMEEDRAWYQTVYASAEGSIAAPTAGLHFTPELIESIEARGVSVRFLTLHVGQGTFRPVRAEVLREHEMDAEVFEVGLGLLDDISALKGRLVTVGTTAARAIESAVTRAYEPLPSGPDTLRGSTSIFITPGYRFMAASAIVTNFHLPRSTPLALAAAMAGTERLMAAYREAVADSYRFFSYGDAMLIFGHDRAS